MQYKTELHAHTCLVSPCANIPLDQEIERYVEAGYSTVVVADHYCDYVIDSADRSWEETCEHYLSGYHTMRELAKGKLNVLLGCELRFVPGGMNDYLVFGMTEEFLRDHPNLHRMTLEEFSALARERGLLLVQAHPFRNGMNVVDPKYLDGMEAFNGHRGHHSRNYLANEQAERYGLIKTSGSDFHHPDSEIAGGILTDEPITSMQQLVSVLRSGDYTLICSGTAALRDGMANMPAKGLKK